MTEMYKRIDDLCKSRKITVSGMCRDLEIHRSILSELSSGRSKSLSSQNTAKIANYFNVSNSYILGEQKETPALTQKDERDIKNKIDEILDMMSSQEGLMFDGDPLTPEALQSIRSAMELGMTAATIKNKEKYNPNKNKKD
jgi:transcriptional regulator with XRE-family HTH domain